jgi:hypothetical protein
VQGDKGIDISKVDGDVIGAGVSGSRNIIAKNIIYIYPAVSRVDRFGISDHKTQLLEIRRCLDGNTRTGRDEKKHTYENEDQLWTEANEACFHETQYLMMKGFYLLEWVP